MEPTRKDELVEQTVRTTRTVATIGAKAAGTAPAFTVPRRMVQRGIRVIPVNPTIPEASPLETFGERARKNIAEVGEPVDVVQVFRRSEHLPGIAREILALPKALRPRVVWLQPGIYDAGAVGALRSGGIEVIVDRCYAVELAYDKGS